MWIERAIPVLAAVFVSACGCCQTSGPRIQSYPAVSAARLVADDASVYFVTTTVRDDDGYSDIVDVRVLFNYTEADGDTSKGRGYLAWGASDHDITRYGGSWELANAGGAGRWGYSTDLWGSTLYITPMSCTVTSGGSASGAVGTRTVTWTFSAKPAWAMNPLTNDADVWARDASGTYTTWMDNPEEFDVVAAPCTTYAATPRPPVVGGATSGSLDVAIAPEDSDTDVFCIRLSPAVLGRDYVQADGTVGGWPVFRTRADWGTTTVSGVPSDTEFSFRVRAAGDAPGYCPSEWSQPSHGVTSVLCWTPVA